MIARYSVSLFNYSMPRIEQEGHGVMTRAIAKDLLSDMRSMAKLAGNNLPMTGEVALAADHFLRAADKGELSFESAADRQQFEKLGAEQAQVWKDGHASRGPIGKLWDAVVADADGDGLKDAKDAKPLGRF